MTDHLPPHSIEAEQHVLGAILLAPEAFDTCSALISEHDLYSDVHRKIWRAIAGIALAGAAVDPVTVVARLDSAGELEGVGGIQYVGGLRCAVATAHNVEQYAIIIRERSLLRQLAGAAATLQALAVNPLGRSVTDLVEEAAGVFDPARVVDRLALVRAEVERMWRESRTAWLALPLGDVAAPRHAVRTAAFREVLRLIDGLGL